MKDVQVTVLTKKYENMRAALVTKHAVTKQEVQKKPHEEEGVVVYGQKEVENLKEVTVELMQENKRLQDRIYKLLDHANSGENELQVQLGRLVSQVGDLEAQVSTVTLVNK